jgi:hypothetical protein
MIGKTITKLLKDNAQLLALVSTDNIFPYVVKEDTSLPFIVYAIDSITSGYTKDGWAGDDVTFSVMSFHTDYAILQSIVKEVRDALELDSDTGTQRIILTGFIEGFNISENAFMNKQTFLVRINSY